MKIVKIKTSKQNRANKSVLFGKDKIIFNDDCIAEVSEKIVKSLLERDKSLSLIDLDNNDGDNENMEYKKELLAMNKNELLGLAKSSGFPEKEYSSLNKDILVDYLLEKLTSKEE